MKSLLSFFIQLVILILTVFTASAQINTRKFHQEVLQAGIVDSLFIFGKWSEKGGVAIHLKYLGQVTTRHRQTFKIINSISFWGQSRRATSRILIFNGKNQYVGNYYLAMTYELPGKLRNGKLIFNNTSKDCDKKQTTVINLKNGIPKQFFRKCKDENGDTYNFESN